MLQSKTKTIVIFGGLLKKEKERDGHWRTERFNYIRVLAGYYLYKELSKKYKTRLIVSGGKGIYKDILHAPTVSSVMKKELISLGLSPKEVREESKTASTYQELAWLSKNIKKADQKTIIISNAYHLPRIKTMIGRLSELKNLKDSVKLLSAEKIVIKNDKKWISKIAKASKSLAMRKIIIFEQGGVKSLKSGKYKLR